MLFEILFDGFLGFTDINGQKEQSFAGEIMTDLVHEVGFVGAVAAPSGTELQQKNFPFDGVIGELFADRRGGNESGGRFLVLGFSQQAESGEE